MNSLRAKARAAVAMLLVAFFLIGMNVPACGTAVHTEVAVQVAREAAAADPGVEVLKKNLQRTLRRIVALQIRELISAVMS